MEARDSSSNRDSSRAREEGDQKISLSTDEDWKAEAQKEKARLDGKDTAKKARQNLPPPTFAAFMGDLGIQAMLALGLARVDEAAEKPRVDLPGARYLIDILGVLEEKTRGNVSPDEKKQLEDLLQSLRLNYARASNAIEEEGKKIKKPPGIIT